MTIVYRVFLEWQTIIASIIALFAAYVATKPVSRQASWLKTQTLIQSREILFIRRKNIDDIKQEIEEAFDGLIEDDEIYTSYGRIFREKRLLSSLRFEEILVEDGINPDWAKEKHSSVEATIERLTLISQNHSYIEMFSDKISQIIDDLEKLRKCLYFIFYGNSEDFDRDKEDLETEPSFVAEVNREFNAAYSEIQNHILSVSRRKKEVDTMLMEERQILDKSLAVCDASLQNLS